MTRTRLTALRSIYSELKRACDKAGASDHFAACFAAALVSERQHRRMGAAFCGARYKHSVQDAAHYFVCKWLIEGPRESESAVSWRQACSIRDDARFGYACHEALVDVGYEFPAFDYDYDEFPDE